MDLGSGCESPADDTPANPSAEPDLADKSPETADAGTAETTAN